MSISSREFVRVPPDGAGKALLTGHVRLVGYIGGSPGGFSVGDVVVGATSTATGTITGVHEQTGPSGEITVVVPHDHIETDFTVTEDLEVLGSPIAQVASSSDYHVSQAITVGANNPRWGQSIDVKGAASVRFPEGAPNFDAGGVTEVSSENWIGIYAQTYDENPNLIHTWTTGTGVLNYDVPSATTELQVQDTSGDSVIRQTHLYHSYRSGVPMSAIMTIAAGNSNTNCLRRWGYFDENDGLFFEYDGTQVCVVQRSSATGSVVETRIPQAQWNGDRMDGSGDLTNNPSQANLDVEQFCLYNISFLYLGAGPSRFSVVVNGERVTLHTFANGGETVLPYMRTGSLPLRWEITNTGATAGPTQLRQGNSTVMAHGDWAPQKKIYGSEPRPAITINTPTAIGVIRAKQTHEGQDNRGIVLPTELRIISTAEPIHVKVTRGGTFTIDTWFQDNTEALLEQGVLAGGPPTITDAGTTIYSHLVVPGEVGYIDLEKSFSVRADGEIKRQADISQAVLYAVIVESATGNPTDVTLALNWSEVY